MAIANAVDATQSGFQSLTTGGVWNGRTLTAGAGISITNGDGTAGNPTISATGTGPGLGTVFVFDDFLGFTATGTGTGPIGNTNFTCVTPGVSTIGPADGSSANPGIVSLNTSTGTGVTIYGNWSTIGFNVGDFALGNGQLSIEWYIQAPTLSNGTNGYTIRCGIGNNVTDTAADPVNGCFWKYTHTLNSGKWVINNIAGGTTSANTNNTVDTNFHNLKIVVNANATSVSFYYDGVEVTGSPLTTNITTNGLSYFLNIQNNLGSGGAVNCDFMRFIYTLTTPRSG